MAKAFANICFTPSVVAVQERQGSRQAYARLEGEADEVLGPSEKTFIEARDGFYLASVSESMWPYVQFRGGQHGFLKVLDPKTLAFLDLRGNRQYLSVGNIMANDRVTLFLMDYPNRRRLKIWGHARIEEDPAAVFPEADLSRAERAIVMTLAAFDWNCPQHIPQRFTLEELEMLGYHL
jgi:predicted pyridoxine 5'-phosphate oxidase superfamily flavin-nucleotide-binding protein